MILPNSLVRKIRVESVLWYHLIAMPFWRNYGWAAVFAVTLLWLMIPSIHFFYFPIGIHISMPLFLISMILTLLLILESTMRNWRQNIQALQHCLPAYCPRCSHRLRTGLAQQCRNCFYDWHTNKSLF
jgi:hypothetical protein